MSKIKFILLIAGAVLLGVVVCLALGYMDIAPFNGFYTMLTGYVASTDISAVANPASLLTTVGSAASIAGVAGVAYTGLKSKLATAQTQVKSVTDKLSTTSDQLETVSADKEAIAAKLSDTQTIIAQKEAAFSTAQTQADAYKAQLDKLQNQYSELQKIRSADVIGSLPGGTVITNPDGSKTAVIEKVVVK